MNQERGNEAFKLHTQIADNEQKRRELMIENILLLEDMREKELYKDYLGDQESKWTAYLSEIEVYYTRAKVQRWIYILNKLVKPYVIDLQDIITLPESRLEEVARYCNIENYQTLLEQAKVLTPHDWKIELSKIKGIDLENCPHNKKDIVEICRDCGIKHNIETI